MVQDAVKKLPWEAKKQAAHVEAVDKNLRRLRELLSQNTVLSTRSSKEMLQKCIIPRLLMSPEDALYSARFIHRMHDLDMPGFPTCLVINEVRSRLRNCVRRLSSTFTNAEAGASAHFGSPAGRLSTTRPLFHCRLSSC